MTSDDRPNPNGLAQKLLQRYHIITFSDTKEIYAYDLQENIYLPIESELTGEIQSMVGRDTTSHYVNEVLNSVRRQTFRNRNSIAVEPRYIPLRNGVFDLEEEVLTEYDPEWDIFLSKHPVWLKQEDLNQNDISNSEISEWLATITETQEDEIMLKELAGYCFYRAMPFHAFFLLVGTGANGKSTYLNILRAVIGIENISNESLQDLSSNRFSKSNLYLKNANIFGDLSKKAIEDSGIIKQLTGNDIIPCERKFKESFPFSNYAKIIASCNEVPETPDMSDAFFRRFESVKFPYSFVGKEDRTLIDRLTTPENLSKFFVESVRAFKAALENNQLIKKEGLLAKKTAYVRLSNSSEAFCDEKLDYDPESELTTEAIYDTYVKYCSDHKLIVRGERQFFMSLYKFFIHKCYKKRKTSEYNDTKQVRYYVVIGVCWK